MHSVMAVFGTRPEAIKLAPLIIRLRSHRVLTPRVVVTAQHRWMLDQVNDVFGIVPDHDLNIIQPRQTLAEITALAMRGLYPVIAAERPAVVVVQGDTSTSFVAALAAFYHQVPVVHLEAGLRSHDRYAPFPEEVNRRLTSQIATLHLAPTRTSRRNLLESGVSAADVVVTGNTVIDALLWTVDRRLSFGDPRLEQLDADDRPMLLVTAHRRESWGEGMTSIGRALAAIARAEPDLAIVLPLHRNPAVREAIEPEVRDLDNVWLTEPLPYGAFARLMERAT
ncbi:MAG: non-hydrolyzing UDP-N-acetylglucosamine 2-epimerase, partial [Nocardioidaceae bacterium]